MSSYEKPPQLFPQREQAGTQHSSLDVQESAQLLMRVKGHCSSFFHGRVGMDGDLKKNKNLVINKSFLEEALLHKYFGPSCPQ